MLGAKHGKVSVPLPESNSNSVVASLCVLENRCKPAVASSTVPYSTFLTIIHVASSPMVISWFLDRPLDMQAFAL